MKDHRLEDQRRQIAFRMQHARVAHVQAEEDGRYLVLADVLLLDDPLIAVCLEPEERDKLNAAIELLRDLERASPRRGRPPKEPAVHATRRTYKRSAATRLKMSIAQQKRRAAKG